MFGRNVTGYGQRRGISPGFRGSSPPWPYVGIGRGGLPRCGYYRGIAAPTIQPTKGTQTGASPLSAPMSKEEELSYLKDQAQVIKEQLDNIESRMHDLEAKE